MTGERGFPLHIPLKPPSAGQILDNLAHLQMWIERWKNFALPELLQWKSASFRQLGLQRLPSRITIGNFQQLTQICGSTAIAQSAQWQLNMQPLLLRYPNAPVYPVLVRHVEVVESFARNDAELLAHVLPQLRPGLGAGGYLRALPLQGADTKFVETHSGLIEARTSLATLEPLMMDVATLKEHEQRVVQEPEPLSTLPAKLTDQERQLYLDLAAGRFLSTRLDQERVSTDFAVAALETWLYS